MSFIISRTEVRSLPPLQIERSDIGCVCPMIGEGCVRRLATPSASPKIKGHVTKFRVFRRHSRSVGLYGEDV